MANSIFTKIQLRIDISDIIDLGLGVGAIGKR